MSPELCWQPRNRCTHRIAWVPCALSRQWPTAAMAKCGTQSWWSSGLHGATATDHKELALPSGLPKWPLFAAAALGGQCRHFWSVKAGAFSVRPVVLFLLLDAGTALLMRFVCRHGALCTGCRAPGGNCGWLISPTCLLNSPRAMAATVTSPCGVGLWHQSCRLLAPRESTWPPP